MTVLSFPALETGNEPRNDSVVVDKAIPRRPKAGLGDFWATGGAGFPKRIPLGSGPAFEKYAIARWRNGDQFGAGKLLQTWFAGFPVKFGLLAEIVQRQESAHPIAVDDDNLIRIFVGGDRRRGQWMRCNFVQIAQLISIHRVRSENGDTFQ